MLTATIQNKHIDLPLDFSFDMVRQSQLLSFDKLKGDYCPSISFPDTERNRALLNHPNRFELKRTGVKEYTGFELRSDGWLVIAGTLVLQDGFNGYVRGNAGNIAAANADKNITDYNLPEDVTFHNKISVTPGDDDYCPASLTNRYFFKDLTEVYNLPSNTDIEQTLLQFYHSRCGYLVNEKDTGAGYLVNLYNVDLDTLEYVAESDSAMKTNVVTPFLYLQYVLKKLFRENNFELQNIPEDLKNLILYNVKNIVDYQVQTSSYTYERDDGLDGGPTTVIEHYHNITQSVSTFNYADLLPRVPLKDFIIGFQNMLNYASVFRQNNKIDIIDREELITGTSDDVNEYFIGSWNLSEKEDVVLEFKMNHDDNDARFGDFYQDLSEREEDFGVDVADMDALNAITSPVIGELRRVLSLNRIYEYRLDTYEDENGLKSDVVGWYFASIDFQNFKYNEEPGVDKEVETIETTFSTVANSSQADVQQLGRCNLRKNSEADFTPRLLFDVDGTAKNNNGMIFLKWRGSNGLLEKRWKYFAEFWSHRQPVTGYFRFPAHVLHNFDINKKKRTRHGEFIIEKMTTRITHAGIGETKVEGYKVD